MRTVPAVLVVTGLAAEARLLAGSGALCVSSPPESLGARLDEVAATHPHIAAVVSFGLAGGLAPGLAAGTLVVASGVVHGDRTWLCAPDLLRRWRLDDQPFASGTIAGCDVPLLSAAQKSALHRSSGALAVDTESHLAAAFAARRGLPFGVLRAVSDPAHRDLPPLALAAIGPEGGLRWRAIAREIARNPRQLALLPGTALGTARAMRTLGRVGRFLGPGLGLADL